MHNRKPVIQTADTEVRPLVCLLPLLASSQALGRYWLCANASAAADIVNDIESQNTGGVIYVTRCRVGIG